MEEALANLGEHSYNRLPTRTKKKGWDIGLVNRGKKAAIYFGAQDNTILRYEVFIIKKHNGRKFGDLVVPPAEYFPGDEVFGTWAWCYSGSEDGLNAARRRFDEIESGKVQEQESEEGQTEEGNENETEEDAD